MALVERLFEDVPQRRVEVVDLPFVEEALAHGLDLADPHAEAFGGEAYADLEVGPTTLAQAVDHVEEELGAALE